LDIRAKSPFEIWSMKNIGKFELTYNHFYSVDSIIKPRIGLNKINASELQIEDNTVELPLSISYCSFDKRADINRNFFYEKVGISKVIFPEFYFSVDWEQFKNHRLITYVDIHALEHPSGFSETAVLPYYAETKKELSNDYWFRQLLEVYSKFYHLFKENGDIIAANSVNREIQELYTRKYRFLAQTEPTLQNWFRWRLNQLLGFYTKHGTEPSRALVISFYLILIFGVVYFFFPSDWDRTNLNTIRSDMREMKSNNHGKIRIYLKMSYLLLVHLINSFTLSLNSFVTLGFGNIPTTGLARYLCIIQGFFGWFLLSLFTVALINQVSL